MTLYLVRHASAGRRTSSVADFDRQLDEKGWTQAGALGAYLAARSVDEVFSSPATRCTQTVEPLAERLGVEVQITDSLWEGQGVQTTLALVRRLAGAGVEAVLCSHGDTIPMVLDALHAEGVRLEGGGCAKGSIWSLETSDGRIIGGSYTPAPEAVSR